MISQILVNMEILSASQKNLLCVSTKFVVFTMTRAQKIQVCRELFTAIFSEGNATESYNIFRSYLTYFDLGLVPSDNKFSYYSQSYTLTEQAKEILSLDQMLVIKMGVNDQIPEKLLH